MPNPLADCGGEERVGSVSYDGNAGCNGCAGNGCVVVHVGGSPDAGGIVYVAGDGSGGGGGKVEGSVGLVGNTGNGDHGPDLRAPPVLCGVGLSDGAYEI